MQILFSLTFEARKMRGWKLLTLLQMMMDDYQSDDVTDAADFFADIYKKGNNY